MRIIAMSDSHGSRYALEKVFEASLKDGNIFVHLGDGERELELMKSKYPDSDIRHVAGNCDYGSLSPNFDIVYAGDVKILITHGHMYGVKRGTEQLRSMAVRYGCKVALFGHTHCRYQGYEDGIYIMNPGSCSCPRDFSKPSYGYIDITPQGIFTSIVDLEEKPIPII